MIEADRMSTLVTSIEASTHLLGWDNPDLPMLGYAWREANNRLRYSVALPVRVMPPMEKFFTYLAEVFETDATMARDLMSNRNHDFFLGFGLMGELWTPDQHQARQMILIDVYGRTFEVSRERGTSPTFSDELDQPDRQPDLIPWSLARMTRVIARLNDPQCSDLNALDAAVARYAPSTPE